MKPQKYQVWKSQNPLRFVVVTREADVHGCVEIVTVCRSHNKLSMPQDVSNGRLDYASEYRFDGSAGGYTFVAKNLKTFNREQLSVLHYARQLARRLAKDSLPLLAPVTPVLNIGTLNIKVLPESMPKVGEIWREIKGSILRYVQVVGTADDKVKIVTCYATNEAGYRPQATPEAKPTLAKADRFSGKKGGYEYVCSGLTELLSSGALDERFVPAGESLENVLKFAFPALEEGQVWHEVGDQSCFHLVKIVGMNSDEVEVATSYIANDQGGKKVVGKSEVISIEDFAAKAGRFQRAA